MKHARNDYQNRIVDLENIIPEDEPVFLFRAQDKYFVTILLSYVKLVEQDAGSGDIIKATLEQLTRAIEWRKNNTIKSPDMPSQQ